MIIEYLIGAFVALAIFGLYGLAHINENGPDDYKMGAFAFVLSWFGAAFMVIMFLLALEHRFRMNDCDRQNRGG